MSLSSSRMEQTIAAKKKAQFHAQYLLEAVVEEPGTDFELFQRLVARDVNAAPGMPWTLKTSDYKNLFVVQDFSFNTMDHWLREQGLAMSLRFNNPSDLGAPSLLAKIEVMFYEHRQWEKADAVDVKQ